MNLLEAEEMLTERFCPPQPTAKRTSLDQLPAGNKRTGWEAEVGDRRQAERWAQPCLARGRGVLTEPSCLEQQEGPQGSAQPPAHSGHTRLSGHEGLDDRRTGEPQGPGSQQLVLRASPPPPPAMFLVHFRTRDCTRKKGSPVENPAFLNSSRFTK